MQQRIVWLVNGPSGLPVPGALAEREGEKEGRGDRLDRVPSTSRLSMGARPVLETEI